MKYALFRHVTQRPAPSSRALFEALMREAQIPSEEWKCLQPEELKAEKRLEFVCMAETPADVAAEVRKAPLEDYVLFSGEFAPVKVAMPVFVDGKNIDTMSAEWD